MKNLTNTWNMFLNSIPNVVAALIILILAFLTASIAKALISKLMKAVKIDKLFEKAKITNDRRERTKEFIKKNSLLYCFSVMDAGIF